MFALRKRSKKSVESTAVHRKNNVAVVKKPKKTVIIADGSDMSTEEKYLYSSQTPEEYIDRSIKVSLTPGQKASVTRRWLKARDYSGEDIKLARAQHPHWKKKKMKGHRERNYIRRIIYERGPGSRRWSRENVQFLLNNNNLRDFELAEKMQRSIPSIQSKRRQLNAALDILDHDGVKATEKILVEMLLRSEMSVVNEAREKLGQRKGKNRKKRVIS